MWDNPAVAAAFWSAFAATCSALAAGAAFFIQRRNLLESVRPEIVLTGWTRGNLADDGPEALTITKIKNVGRGAGLMVMVGSSMRTGKPNAVIPAQQLPILAPNEEAPVSIAVLLLWPQATQLSGGGPKMIPIRIDVLSWDSANRRHRTSYQLLALESPHPGVAGITAAAPGVSIQWRRTNSRAVRSLKLAATLSRIPLVGRLFHNAAA